MKARTLMQAAARAATLALTLAVTLTVAACGGGGGGTPADTVSPPVNTPPPAPPLLPNVLAMVVDAGPAGAGAQINLPYVSVMVCIPGTSTCKVIDHVLVDTGSYGLRLLANQAQGLALPAVTAPDGKAAGECGQFLSGYTWGSVVKADIALGGEAASAQSVQIIGDAPGGLATAPTACSSIGNNIGSLKALGANGILGVGLLRQDCGNACVNNAIAATYYSCASGACAPSRMPLAQQVSNPVASFAVNNNGVLLRLPGVGAGGAASLSGTLTFGINTQANNTIAGETMFRASSAGNFTTSYKGASYSASFIDSGSNGIFFEDASIPQCTVSKGFYCPTSTLALSATTIAADNSASAVVPFTIENVESLGGGVYVANVGGPSAAARNGGSNAFDWGLPFFFGRRVFVGLENGATPGYWAY
jgi:Protein of unknown function (DUF3443)